MTEAEWLACTDPRALLKVVKGQSTQRKLRLFLCGLCRRLWGGETPRAAQAAVEAAEQYADGVLSEEGLRAAFEELVPEELVPAELRGEVERLHFAMDRLTF